MQTHEESCDRKTQERDNTSDHWAEIILVLACLVALAWIGFTLWLAGEVLGIF